MLSSQRGAAPLDAVIGITLLMVLSLGAIQVALTVYAYNAATASAYEAARAAAEIGADHSHARLVAQRMVATTARGLIDDPRVSVSIERAAEGPVMRVGVVGRQRAIGPIPVSFPIRAEASTLLEGPPL